MEKEHKEEFCELTMWRKIFLEQELAKSCFKNLSTKDLQYIRAQYLAVPANGIKDPLLYLMEALVLLANYNKETRVRE